MSEEILRVTIEFKDLKTIIEGNPEEVFKAFSSFLSKAIPTYKAASNLLYTLDPLELTHDLTDILLFTTDGRIQLRTPKTSIKDAICLTLTGAYVGEKLGELDNVSMTPSEISSVIGKAVKTVRNELPSLVKDGVVERIERGKYQITQRGLMEVKEYIIPKVKELQQQ